MSIAMPQPVHAYDKERISNDASSTMALVRESTSPKPEREISRTPSPTPSELDLLNGVRQPKSLKFKIRIVAILILIIVVIILVEVFHDKIVNALIPVTRWLHDTKAGWLIPILVLIALSFPPLFGHELVAMLCGLVWGLGEGFGIVAAGTILGELATYYLFRHCLAARGKRLELTNMRYGTLAHIVREGGLPIAILVRYSSFPAHFTTAVFSTCGMSFWVFLVAAVVSLPKQLVLVYIGVALASSDGKSNKVQHIVIGVTAAVTVLAFLYIRRLMGRAKPAVVYARRKDRQRKQMETGRSVSVEGQV